MDFDQLLPVDSLNPYAKRIALARERLESGIREAIEWIEQANSYDQLEGIYIEAMDFPAIDQQCADLILPLNNCSLIDQPKIHLEQINHTT